MPTPIRPYLFVASATALISCSEGETGSSWTAPPDSGANDVSADSSAVDAGADSAGPCSPKTCAQLGAVCGITPDGCGGKIACGECSAGQVCGAAGPNKCGSGSCQPKSCAQLGVSCGLSSDGCSDVLDCGNCAAGNPCEGGQTCQAGACVSGVPVVCNAPPNTSCYEATGQCQPSDGTCVYPPKAANCAGKQCGDDGCGHDCGACESGKACTSGTCACDPAMPAGWPSSISPWTWNPVLIPTPAAAPQGADNVYAPEIHFADGAYAMFYGAQGGDGHDQVFLAWSTNGQEWRKYPTDASPQPVLAGGSSNHVNDPSVVRAGATWRMYYTDAPTGENDRIWLAEGTHVHSFQKTGEVLGPVPGTWEADKVGRPAVLLENGVYKMWYDGAANGLRHVGFASSNDGVNFTRHPGNPVFLNAGAIDVKKVGGVYVMLREGGDGTYWATSVDGLCWVDRGKLFGLSGKAYDAYGQVTPFMQVDNGVLKAVWFGGASVNTWNKNRIAVAFPGGASVPSGGGCTACVTAGWSCSSACQTAGAAPLGTCGAPGSTSSGNCCACAAEGCEGCTTHPDCHAACVAAGRGGGWCATPGSSDPGNCCACLP